MSRQNLVKTKGFYVTTGYFYIAREFGQGEEILSHDREFDVATELHEVASRQGMFYVVTETYRT